MTFSAQLRPLVAQIGVARSAETCGVDPRTLHRWKTGGKPPCAAMQAGALLLLTQELERKIATSGYTPRTPRAIMALARAKKPA